MWAGAYWSFKSDRTAPGVPALVIDVEQKLEREGRVAARLVDRRHTARLGAEERAEEVRARGRRDQ